MRGVLCSDCAGLINLDDDLFCMVTPHGERYGYAAMIPLCRQCRAEQGYDILGNYTVVSSTQRRVQPQLPRLEDKRETKHKPENDNELRHSRNDINHSDDSTSNDRNNLSGTSDISCVLEEVVDSGVNSTVEQF